MRGNKQRALPFMEREAAAGSSLPPALKGKRHTKEVHTLRRQFLSAKGFPQWLHGLLSLTGMYKGIKITVHKDTTNVINNICFCE
jgi:hypothetical protein